MLTSYQPGGFVHEYGITQSILEAALDHATAAGANRITQLNLVLSAASHITEDSVEMYFEAISKGSMAEGAVLVFEREPADFRCWSCGHEFQTDTQSPVCPLCGGAAQALPVQGELYLESIDVE
jgi:hydrogenase nickel incorporation protein HypA/HybF